MITNNHPQSQPPLQVEGHSPTARVGTIHPSSRPIYSLSHPADEVGIHPSPTQNSLATAGSDNNNNCPEALTNFMKYGSIRPPVSVLQEEFLEKNRLWREHVVPLEGIDKGLGGRGGRRGGAGGGAGRESSPSSGDFLTGCMASVQTMYARHHRPQSCPDNPDYYEGGGDLSEPRSSLIETEKRSEAVYGKMGEDEEKVAAGDEDEESIGCIVLSADCDERNQLERLAALMFRPGAKLSGSTEIRHEKIRTDYELVVMEGDAMDEFGHPKGMLARHKFAGDEQCIFVKISFAPVPSIEITREEEKESIDYEEASSKEDEAFGDKGGSKNRADNESRIPSEKKLTIQIEYVDGDNRIQGQWNHDTLCFEGTVKKVTEGQGDENQMGGTIVSGLISGHSNFDDGSNNDDASPLGDGNIISRRPSPPNVGTRTFSLSPCSHLHPRGIAPTPLWLSISETLSRLGLLTIQSETTGASLLLRNEPDTSKKSASNVVTPAKQKVLLDEIASHDNYRLVLHRARTETLRRETLVKLVELGSVVDFAELARKRNVAKRRERWRKSFRKYTPALPRRLLRRGRTSKTTGGEGDFNLSKDHVQKKKVQFYDQLAAISWGELLEEASVRAETTCAVFRRQTALLDNLTFDSDEYKAQIMSDLRNNRLTLAASHSEWDQCIQMGRTVALGWSWFERGSWSCFERSAVVGKRCVYLLFQMHSRLEANHQHLEKAYRGADARLTNVQLERIRVGSHDGCRKKSKGGEVVGDESDGICGICQCDFDEGGENENEENPAVCLPCSHSFHWECIREWLHNHSQCPICRVDLHAS